MAFTVRENDPRPGRVTLYFVHQGAFIATRREVGEAEFLAEIKAFIKRRYPASEDIVEPASRQMSPLGEPRRVRLNRKSAAQA